MWCKPHRKSCRKFESSHKVVHNKSISKRENPEATTPNHQ
nr:MAG TPA: hypothetical protein [Caudoviricetes sp.]